MNVYNHWVQTFGGIFTAIEAAVGICSFPYDNRWLTNEHWDDLNSYQSYLWFNAVESVFCQKSFFWVHSCAFVWHSKTTFSTHDWFLWHFLQSKKLKFWTSSWQIIAPIHSPFLFTCNLEKEKKPTSQAETSVFAPLWVSLVQIVCHRESSNVAQEQVAAGPDRIMALITLCLIVMV